MGWILQFLQVCVNIFVYFIGIYLCMVLLYTITLHTCTHVTRGFQCHLSKLQKWSKKWLHTTINYCLSWLPNGDAAVFVTVDTISSNSLIAVIFMKKMKSGSQKYS